MGMDELSEEDKLRPNRAETSEPAWVKRKMLSMKRSTSLFSTSRKYSAMVRPERPTRIRAPGGSFIYAITVQNGEETITLEVAQHVGDNVARCIAMAGTDGLVRGMKAVDTGGPLHAPVGTATL